MKAFFGALTVCTLLLSCKGEQAKEEFSIQSVDSTISTPIPDEKFDKKDCEAQYQKALKTDSLLYAQTELDLVLANQAIKVFTDYAYYCDNDSLSPVYLVKTAQIAMSINNSNQAKVVLDHVVSKYPKFVNLAAAKFLMARLYDEQTWLNDPEEAKKWYNRVIEDHPKSDWANSAKGAIKLVGKSDEQIIQEFKKKK